MMTIKMLRNDRGSEDGVTVKYYEKDETYEVATSLGSTLVKSGSAERVSGDDVEADPVPESVELAPTKAEQKQGQKSVPGAPENRMQKGAPSNKQGGQPTYEVGKVYEQDGKVFVAVGEGATTGLLPVEKLKPEERAKLVSDGKLTADGKVPAAS